MLIALIAIAIYCAFVLLFTIKFWGRTCRYTVSRSGRVVKSVEFSSFQHGLIWPLFVVFFFWALVAGEVEWNE